MTTTRQPSAEDGSLGRDLLHALHYYLGGRRGLLVLAAVALAGGLAFNWNWLVAAGIAPLLLSALPCVAMCALGLCMNRMSGRACTPNQAANPDASGADGGSRSEHSAAPAPDRRPVGAECDIQSTDRPCAF